MSEKVVPIEVPAWWDPNIDDAVLAVSEEGWARLVVRAHPKDGDRRAVEIFWKGVAAARMEPPNDEARASHRLYEAGLTNAYANLEAQSNFRPPPNLPYPNLEAVDLDGLVQATPTRQQPGYDNATVIGGFSADPYPEKQAKDLARLIALAKN